MNQKRVFQAFSDESGINAEDRYTSIAVVSGEAEILGFLRDELAKEVNDKGIDEVKFSRVTRYKSPVSQAAKIFINCVINKYAILNQVRIDTITIDNDSPDCGDKNTLERMYYCLIAHMVRLWNNTHWNFYPDVNSKINWGEIISYLSTTRLHKRKNKNPLLIELMLEENPRFKFGEVKQLPSIQEPLIQLADFFAGLARFSHEEDVDCTNWVIGQKNRRQQKMKLCQENKVNNVNRTRECRYKLIGELYYLCRKHRLGVSIRTKKHLNTWRPNYPINFWDYKRK